MPKFEDVRAAQALIMPLAEKALGFAVLTERRPAITKSIAEAVDDPSGKKLAGLTQMFTALAKTPPAKAPAVRAAFTEAGVLDEARRLVAEAEAAAAAKPKNPVVEQRVKAELFQRSQVARRMLGRGLTLPEQQDLEQAISERFGESFAGTTEVTGPYAFGEAVLAGRLGPNNSPGIAPPQVRTSSQISEDAAVFSGQSVAALKAEMNRVARLTTVEGIEAFGDHILAFARTVPFGAQRLDDPQGA
jgi:hypothetical protein